MIVYLAAVSTMEPYFQRGSLAPDGVSVLASYYGITEFEGKNAGRFKNIIIDSGAFTFMNGRKALDWDKYTEDYADWLKRHKIEKFFELDIDAIVGLREVERLRSKLERLTGRQPIPVWHKSRGKDYFIGMTKEYPYVAIGGIVTHEIPRGTYEAAFPWFINKAHENGAKIHGLGYTSISGINKYRFDSVDSTTWLVGAKYGNICKVTKTSGKQIHRPGTRVKDSRELAYYNFKEWLRFQQYAEKHL